MLRRGAKPEPPGPPCRPRGSHASPVCHLGPCSRAGVGRGEKAAPSVWHDPPRGPGRTGRAGRLLGPSPTSSASALKQFEGFLTQSAAKPGVPICAQSALGIPVSRKVLQSVQRWGLGLPLTRRGEETLRVRCGCAASRGGAPGGRCPRADPPLSPLFSCHRGCDSLLSLSRCGHGPGAPAHAHASRAALTALAHTHARTRVSASRSATLWGAPRGARPPGVVVGRRPRPPAVLSNGPGSPIGPAAGTTPARLLHSSDTRASRDI